MLAGGIQNWKGIHPSKSTAYETRRWRVLLRAGQEKEGAATGSFIHSFRKSLITTIRLILNNSCGW